MAGELTQFGSRSVSAELAPDLQAALRFAKAEKSTATRRAYATDYRLFCQWCEARALSPMPASVETVAAYLAHEAENGCRPSTIARRCAAIRYAHKLAGNESPTTPESIKATVRGIRRAARLLILLRAKSAAGTTSRARKRLANQRLRLLHRYAHATPANLAKQTNACICLMPGMIPINGNRFSDKIMRN